MLAADVKVDLAHAASMLALIFAVLGATCASAPGAAAAMVPGLGRPAAGSGEVLPAQRKEALRVYRLRNSRTHRNHRGRHPRAAQVTPPHVDQEETT
jgi:hypothetical protein